MSESKGKKSIKNIVLSFSSQLLTLALGLILPRLLITGFGSEVNGFFGTVTQLYSCLEVLRAGVGMAAIQALYKPIIEKDDHQISRILSTSKGYFQKIGYVYLGISLALSVGFVIFGHDTLSNIEIFLIVMMQGVSGWISFSLINWFVDYLRADGKNYVFIAIQTVGSIVIKILEIAMIYATHSPVIVKASSLAVVTVEYVIFTVYRKKNYRTLVFDGEQDISLLKNRKSYLAFHISSLICTNTDVVVLSLFCGYEMSSVYSVYYMIVNGVNTIVNTVYSSTSFILGHSYQEGMDSFVTAHDTYYLVYTTLTTSLFAACYVLMTPFIKLYTAGVTDVNYLYPFLPLLFCVIQILMCSKNVGDITINVGGLARKVVWRSALEAGINIVLSLILVQFIGIYGVLIGTIAALTYRLIDVMWFSNKNVLKRSPVKNVRVFLTNLLIFAIVVVLNEYWTVTVSNYLEFFLYAIVVSIVLLITFFGILLALNPKERKTVTILAKRFIKKRL